MSHNKIKVGGQSPTNAGEISVSLDNLSDVSVSSVTDGTLLKYDSGWTFGIAGFESSDYSFLASNRDTGSVTTVYDDTTENSIRSDSRDSGYGTEENVGSSDVFSFLSQSGATFSGGGGKRYTGFDLPANSKFLLILSHTPIFNSSTGQTVLQWVDENDNTLGPQVQVKRDDRGSKKLYGYIEVGGSSVKVFPTCISTNNHRRKNLSDGDSWQAIRIG